MFIIVDDLVGLSGSFVVFFFHILDSQLMPLCGTSVPFLASRICEINVQFGRTSQSRNAPGSGIIFHQSAPHDQKLKKTSF